MSTEKKDNEGVDTSAEAGNYDAGKPAIREYTTPQGGIVRFTQEKRDGKPFRRIVEQLRLVREGEILVRKSGTTFEFNLVNVAGLQAGLATENPETPVLIADLGLTYKVAAEQTAAGPRVAFTWYVSTETNRTKQLDVGGGTEFPEDMGDATHALATGAVTRLSNAAATIGSEAANQSAFDEDEFQEAASVEDLYIGLTGLTADDGKAALLDIGAYKNDPYAMSPGALRMPQGASMTIATSMKAMEQLKLMKDGSVAKLLATAMLNHTFRSVTPEQLEDVRNFARRFLLDNTDVNERRIPVLAKQLETFILGELEVKNPPMRLSRQTSDAIMTAVSDTGKLDEVQRPEQVLSETIPAVVDVCNADGTFSVGEYTELTPKAVQAAIDDAETLVQGSTETI